jgi:hypothetical protein
MSKIPRIISAYYGHGDQLGFVVCKDKIYDFMIKNKLIVHHDALWSYNSNLKVWKIIWPNTKKLPIFNIN